MVGNGSQGDCRQGWKPDIRANGNAVYAVVGGLDVPMLGPARNAA